MSQHGLPYPPYIVHCSSMAKLSNLRPKSNARCRFCRRWIAFLHDRALQRSHQSTCILGGEAMLLNWYNQSMGWLGGLFLFLSSSICNPPKATRFIVNRHRHEHRHCGSAAASCIVHVQSADGDCMMSLELSHQPVRPKQKEDMDDIDFNCEVTLLSRRRFY